MGLLGIRAPMASHAALILLNEFGLPNNRSYLSMASTIIDNSSNLFIPLFFYFFGDWRGLILINTGFLFIILLIVIFFIPEAPRFYQSHHKYKEARTVYTFLAKRNNREMFTERLHGERVSQNRNAENQFQEQNKECLKVEDEKTKILNRAFSDNSRKARWSDMIRSPFVFITLFGPFGLMSSGIVFTGIQLGLNTLSGDLIMNGIFTGLGDILAGVSIGFFANIYGRVGYYVFGWGLSTLSFFIYFFIQNSGYSAYVPLFTGKFATTTCFSLMYLLLYESYPTNLRASFIGISVGVGRIGSAFAPVIADRMRQYAILVYVLIGCLCFAGSFFITETRGKPMIERITPSSVQN